MFDIKGQLYIWICKSSAMYTVNINRDYLKRPVIVIIQSTRPVARGSKYGGVNLKKNMSASMSGVYELLGEKSMLK